MRSEEEINQMIASNVVFMMAAMQQVLLDEFLLLYESLYGNKLDTTKKRREDFFELIRSKFYDDDDNPREPHVSDLKGIAHRLGEFLLDRTAIQNVERMDPFTPRVALASNETNSPCPTPFAISSKDNSVTNSCAGKVPAVYVMCQLFLALCKFFEPISEAIDTKVASPSSLDDSFYRVADIVERTVELSLCPDETLHS